MHGVTAGAGAGAGAGAARASSRRVKVSVPAAGGYDKLQLVEFEAGGTTGPNLTAEDDDMLVTVSTSHVGINYADICVRWCVQLAHGGRWRVQQ